MQTLRSTLVRLVLPALVALGLLLAPSVASAQSKIAVVDVRRAVLETEEGLRVQATLKKLFDSRQVELDAKQRQLQADKDALDKEAASGKGSKDALQKKYENLQKQFNEMQTTMVDYQREMQRKEGELTTPILQKVLDIVRRIASQEGYEMIVDKSVVPYFRSDLEVTDRAIQMYNSGQAAPAPGGKGPATPPATPKKDAPAPPPAAPPKKK